MDFSDKLIEAYQQEANHTLARVCRWAAGFMVLIGVLNFAGIFIIKGAWLYSMLGFALFVSMLPTLVFDMLKINARWSQYMVLTTIVIMCNSMYAVVSYHSVIMLVFPLVCASLYSERSMIVYTMLISIPCIIIAHLVAFQLKIVPDEPLVTLHGVVLYGILPRLIQYVAIGVIAVNVTGRMRHLIEALIRKNNDLYEDQQMLITSLSELIETQSQETGLHVKRVSEYTRVLCEGLGYNAEDTWQISIAAMMHDVGKLLVPSAIIEKPGRLTDEEFEQVKKHVDYGKKMLEKSPGEMMQLSAIIAYQHHEKWDGTGYKHLKGEQIAPSARCVALADVFDALVSWRPYKKPWTAQQAYDEIVSQSGKHFDPAVVDVFRTHFAEFEEVLEKYPDSREVPISELEQEARCAERRG